LGKKERNAFVQYAKKIGTGGATQGRGRAGTAPGGGMKSSEQKKGEGRRKYDPTMGD